MKSTDKFLIGIVAGIVLIVIVAFVITMTRPEATYQADDTPKGVAHNYLLALEMGEYERAYGYLSPTLKCYPASTEKFTEDVESGSWRFRANVDNNLSVKSAEVTGNRATVKVLESRFNGGDLFNGNQQTSVFEMELRLEDGAWKVVDSEYYFAWNWKRYCN